MRGSRKGSAAGAPALSVIVPCRDEAHSVPPLAAALREILPRAGPEPWEIVFVDDGSRDATAARIRDEAARGPAGQVRLVRLERPRGQGIATAAGWRRARGRLLVAMDADLQHPPAAIPDLLAPLRAGRADFVQGVRADPGDGLPGRLSRALRDRIAGDRQRDPTCAFRAFRRECVAALEPFPGIHRQLATLVARAGHRVVEVPVDCAPRRSGASKYGRLAPGFGLVRDALRVRLRSQA